MKFLKIVFVCIFALGLIITPGMTGMTLAEDPAGDDQGSSGDATGTDPRDFSSKFMPYYRYMELESDVEINMFTLFGMHAFTPRFALTYEWPLAMEVDYTKVEEYKQFQQGNIPDIDLPRNGPNPGRGGNVPFSTLDPDGDVIGMGDLNLRFFVRPEQWEWTFWEGDKSMSLMPVIETTLPTATKDLLGDESWILSPGFTWVTDMPVRKPPFGLGFLALMNFYDFDVIKDNSRPYTSRFRGRWFWMQPLSIPGHIKNPGDDSYQILNLAGLYVLTEFQPVYDFRASNFSFWFGPELGKIIKDGQIFYLKPGWGVDNSLQSDREFTFEVGFRYFM